MTAVQDILQQVSVDRLRAHIQALEGVRHPVSAPAALEAAADYVHTTLAGFGYPVMDQPFLDAGQTYRNIIATRTGSQHPDARVIILAHYDSEINTPGANDNASGVAAVLELARVFAPLRFARTVHFVGVSLEENSGRDDKLYARGSTALAEHARANEWQITGVIDFEEIGYAGDDIPQKTPPGLPIALPESGNFIGVVGNQVSAGLVEGFVGAVTQYAIPLPFVPLVVPGNGEMLPDTRRSDHAPFWDQGYPAIMVTDMANFRTPHYHQPSDTLDTLNLDFAAAVCRTVGGLAINLAGLSE